MTYLYCMSDHVFSSQKMSTGNRCIFKYLYECVYIWMRVSFLVSMLFAIILYVNIDLRFKSLYRLNFSLLIL